MPAHRVVTFGLDAQPDFGVRDGWLVEGDARIVEVSALSIHGAHNVAVAVLHPGTLSAAWAVGLVLPAL